LWQLKGDSSRVDLPPAPDNGKGHTLPLPLVCSLHGARARLRRRGEEDYDTRHGEKDIQGRQVVGKANILSPNRVSIMHSTQLGAFWSVRARSGNTRLPLSLLIGGAACLPSQGYDEDRKQELIEMQLWLPGRQRAFAKEIHDELVEEFHKKRIRR